MLSSLLLSWSWVFPVVVLLVPWNDCFVAEAASFCFVGYWGLCLNASNIHHKPRTILILKKLISIQRFGFNYETFQQSLFLFPPLPSPVPPLSLWPQYFPSASVLSVTLCCSSPLFPLPRPWSGVTSAPTHTPTLKNELLYLNTYLTTNSLFLN